MSKYVASESNDHYQELKTGGKRGRDDEENENGEGKPEVPPAESLVISTPSPTAPPAFMTKLRKSELRTELDDGLVNYDNKDTKADLMNLLIFDMSLDAARAHVPPPQRRRHLAHMYVLRGQRQCRQRGSLGPRTYIDRVSRRRQETEETAQVECRV